MDLNTLTGIGVSSANFPCSHCGLNVKIPAVVKIPKLSNSACKSTLYLSSFQEQMNSIRMQITQLQNETQAFAKAKEELINLQDDLKLEVTKVKKELLHSQDDLKNEVEKKLTHFRIASHQDKNKRKKDDIVFKKRFGEFNQAKESLENRCINLEKKLFKEEADRRKTESDHLIQFHDFAKSKISLNEANESLEKRYNSIEGKFWRLELSHEKSETDLLREIHALKSELKYEEMSRNELNASSLKKFDDIEKQLGQVELIKKFCTDLEEKLYCEEDSRRKAESDYLIKFNGLEESKNSLVKICSSLEVNIRGEKLEREELNDFALKKIDDLEKDKCQLIERCNNFQERLCYGELAHKRCIDLEKKLSNEEDYRKKSESDLLSEISNLKENIKYEEMSRQALSDSSLRKFDEIEMNQCKLISRCNIFDEQLSEGGLVEKRCTDLEEKLTTEENSRKKEESDLLTKINYLEDSKKSLDECCSNLKELMQGEKLEREKLNDIALKKIYDLEKYKSQLNERCNSFEERLCNEELAHKSCIDLEGKFNNEKIRWKQVESQHLIKINDLEKDKNLFSERCTSLEEKLKYEERSRQEISELFQKRCVDLEKKLSNEEDNRKEAEIDHLNKINALEKRNKTLVEHCSILKNQIQSEKVEGDKKSAFVLKKIEDLENGKSDLVNRCNNFEEILRLGESFQKRCIDLEKKLFNEEDCRNKLESKHLSKINDLEETNKSMNEHYSNLKKQMQDEKMERQQFSATALKKIDDLEEREVMRREERNKEIKIIVFVLVILFALYLGFLRKI